LRWRSRRRYRPRSLGGTWYRYSFRYSISAPRSSDGDPHEIADRQHGQEAVAADDGQVANVGLIHLVRRGLIILVRVRNDELRGHHLLQPRTSSFTVDHPTGDVALGEHPTEPLAVEDRDDPDIAGWPSFGKRRQTVVSRWSMKRKPWRMMCRSVFMAHPQGVRVAGELAGVK